MSTKICLAIEIAQEDGTTGYGPAIPFSEFPPGPYRVGPDDQDPTRYAYWHVDTQPDSQ